MTMVLISDFVRVGAPFGVAAARLRAAAPAAFAGAAAAAFHCPEAVESLLETSVRERFDALVLDLRWPSNPFGARFHHFEGELQLAPLATTQSYLGLSAS